MHIIGGHQRYDTLLDMYMENNSFTETLNLIRLGDIGWVFPDTDLQVKDEDHEKALNLALNKINGEWDYDKLQEVLQELELSPLNVELTGFDNEEIKELDTEYLEDETQVIEDNYNEEDTEDTDIKHGDIFKLGNHMLICGDATSKEDIETLIKNEGGGRIDMLFTDPPYNCNYGTSKHPKLKVKPIMNDNMTTETFQEFCKKWVQNITLFVEGCCYICAGPGKDGRVMFQVCDELLHNSTVIVWNKDTFTVGKGKYQNKYEPIWFGWNNSGKTFTDKRNLSNVFDIERPKKSELHPTMKPIKLITTCLEHNPHAKTVLDLFGGSGSTLIACEQTNRNCYMMELNPYYCQVIIDRWEQFTGKKAVKLN